MNSYFNGEDIQMANKYMKRNLLSLNLRETQIETTMKYHYTFIRITKIKKSPHKMLVRILRNWITPILLMGI